MKKLKKIMAIFFLSLAGVLLIGLLIIRIYSPGKLSPLKDTDGNIIEGSISEKLWMDINGLRQGMFIRGENPENPVILYLHGGPGTPLLPFISYLEKNERLEKYFTICYWDQRGSGMSYNSSIDPKTMTVEQMVEDAHQVTQYLKSRFGQRKIYLVGHSWGSYLGVKTIQKYPEDYLAYIGIGQLSNQRESERLAYKHICQLAEERGDKDVLDKLSKYNPDSEDFPHNDYLIKVRTLIVNKYGIGMMREGVTITKMLKGLISFKGYTISEKINFAKGADFSMDYLFQYVMNDSLNKSSIKFDVPFYITHGIYDYQVSYTLAKEYMEIMEAPKKGFFTLDNSAHSPNIEEPEKFIEIMRNIAMENTLE